MARKTIIKNARTTIPVPAPAADDAIEATIVEPEPELGEPDEPAALEEDVPERDLDEDPETSLVGSLYLHLLGEHNHYDALRLDDDDALTLHAELHQDHEHHHPVEDLRFRPARALAASVQLPADAPPA